jgi:AraC-like DNA-binding protein
MKQIYRLFVVIASFLFSPALWGQNDYQEGITKLKALRYISTLPYANDELCNYYKQAETYYIQIENMERHIDEKERRRFYFLLALTGCVLLTVTLGIWIHYDRKIAKKNRVLASQIRELTAQQKLRETELLNKTSFIDENGVALPDNLCLENRKDKLCIAIHNLLLQEKAYRNPSLTRDYMIERLGTNREMFTETFHFCFGMSFPEYVNELRMRDAIVLLEQSDMSIGAISEQTGFGTIRTFQRQFQKKYNLSPKNYRSMALPDKGVKKQR